MATTWAFLVDPGATNSSFNPKAVLSALQRVSRYWAVDFVQVTSNPWMRFVLTKQVRPPTWAAWTSGRTIYIPSSFRYQSLAQTVYVLTHEIGHVYGGSSHASGSGHVMSAEISDIYRNFTQVDYGWYRMPIRSGVPKAWEEPNYWRPARAANEVDEDYSEPCDVGHGSWLDYARGFFSSAQAVNIEEQ